MAARLPWLLLLLAQAAAGMRTDIAMFSLTSSQTADTENVQNDAEGAASVAGGTEAGVGGLSTVRERFLKKARQEECKLPDAMLQRYRSPSFLGRGTRGCAYLVQDEDSNNLVVKVAAHKSKNVQKDWRYECTDQMQNVHKLACQKGAEHLQLVEQYLPTCLEVGTADDRAYLVMQAAGNKHLADLRELHLSVEEAQSVFAQLVAALHAMHCIGFSHNDFHDKNIMVSKGTLHIAVVDFGRMKAKARSETRNNLHRDSRALLKHLAGLAQCEGSSKSMDRLDDCLVEKWEVDEGFVMALRAVVDGCRQATKDQHINELYNTAFVQKHLPPLKKHYHLPGNCE
eukprot:CAMPEP_0197906162 /NCGR_PEP_ID=MMETSP1439-20131203/62027_1 /TAXON_ID=66791 /ORGANISM="Gonyaulax spinifera, Strain CCMP409" /LENGTH=341 /DNA_ID=CAMNT_0043527495 /DNA_START=60 /DNA_END=1085 /DNA_ORIENTATION=+